MLIGELAARTGATARALRHYEDRNLLVPARDVNGYRAYSESDIPRVAQIRIMIAAGLSADTVRRYVDCARTGDHGLSLEICPDLRAELDAVATRLDAQLSAVRATRERLRALAAAG